MTGFDFQTRLERLEKQNRRLRVAGFSLCGLACLLLMLGQAKPKERTLEAESFVLVDKEGTTRASLGLLRDGAVGLHLKDTNGKTRVKLSVQGDQTAQLELLNENEQTRVALFDHFVRHLVNDEERKDWRNFGCGLSLYAGEGDPRTTFPLASFRVDNGYPSVTFSKRLPSVVFRDDKGRKSWKVPPPGGEEE